MPDYVATFHYVDANNGESFKQFTGTFVDNATAQANLSALFTDLQAATDAQIDYYTLAEKTEVAGAPAAGSNVFERVSATVTLDGTTKRANMQFPSPDENMFSGNALDPASTEWVNLIANFATGLWQISDGENVGTTVAGKRIYVSSGSTNLPS